MAGQAGSEIHVREILETKRREVSKLTTSSTISRAPPALRQVNEGAFEPQIISIGPFHHGKEHLKAMETHKVNYLNSLLDKRPGGLDMDRYIAAYMSIDQNVRGCYDDDDMMRSLKVRPLSPADFRAIMVLDGLFVVQLIRKFNDDLLIEQNDTLFKKNSNLSIVALDLLLLENQLPFCLLEMFACMIGPDDRDTFAKQALKFFSQTEPRLDDDDSDDDDDDDYPINVSPKTEHLLCLVHDNWIPRPQPPPQPEQSHVIEAVAEENREQNRKPAHKVKRSTQRFCDSISSATELSERGIKFMGTFGTEKSLFDIKFKRKTLTIPTLIVDHDTERIFRNLIAYEQCKHDVSVVMDYARFMDCLINYADDVALLCDSWVIDNRLGSNEDVAKMINKLNEYVHLFTNDFYYSDRFDDVNNHYYGRLTSLKVKLRQAHSNNPWDWVLISILAGTLLLILTIVQTVFTVLPYFKKGAS